MAKKNKDFDSYLQERRKLSSEFTVFGETFILPPTIPYDAVLLFEMLQERGQSEEVSGETLFDIFQAVIGKANVDKLRQHVEFDVDLMTEIIKYALDVYGVTENKSEDTTPGPKPLSAQTTL